MLKLGVLAAGVAAVVTCVVVVVVVAAVASSRATSIESNALAVQVLSSLCSLAQVSARSSTSLDCKDPDEAGVSGYAFRSMAAGAGAGAFVARAMSATATALLAGIIRGSAETGEGKRAGTAAPDMAGTPTA